MEYRILVATLMLIDRDDFIRRRLADEIGRDGRYRALDAPSFSADVAAEADLLVVAVEPDQAGDGWPADLPVIALVPAGAAPVEGADETLVRPLKLATLIEAIARVLNQPGRILIGPYRFESRTKLLIDRRGRDRSPAIRLTEKEVAILECLYRANAEVVPRERLLQEVWGYNSEIATHTLETHVYRLRRKIETGPAATGLLITEPGGYRLVP